MDGQYIWPILDDLGNLDVVLSFEHDESHYIRKRHPWTDVRFRDAKLIDWSYNIEPIQYVDVGTLPTSDDLGLGHAHSRSNVLFHAALRYEQENDHWQLP